MDGSRSDLVRVAYSFANFQKTGGPPTVDYYWIPQSWTNFRNGSLNKRYRQQISEGSNATTAATGSMHEARWQVAFQSNFWDAFIGPGGTRVDQYQYQIGPKDLFFMAPYGNLHSDPDMTPQAEAKAASSLYKKLFQAHHQLQGGVVLGEIHKTAEMLVKSARFLKGGIFSYLAEARKLLDKRRKRESLKKVADLYLETVFGWQPLLFDCKDAAIALGRLSNETDKAAVRAIGFAEDPSPVKPTVTSEDQGFLIYSKLIKYHLKAWVKYYGHLKTLPYEAGRPPAERIASLSGFDLRSFIPTVWELIPYSFLIDYFTNIGDCLYAFSFDHSYVKALSRTAVRESMYRETYTPNLSASRNKANNAAFSAGNSSVSGMAGFSSVKLRTFSRAPTGLPVLLPALTLGDLGGKQFLNCAALLVGDRAKASRSGWS